jgi:two-component system, NarL family, response regulator NreC
MQIVFAVSFLRYQKRYSMSTKLRVIVNDDEEIYKEGILHIVRQYPQLDLAVVVQPGEDPIATVQRVRPHIFITSIHGKVIDGISATKLITQKFPNVSVLAIAMFQHDTQLVDIVQAGAKGCLTRSAPKQEVLQAIASMHNGQQYYSSQVNGQIAHLIATNYFTDFKGQNPVHNLTQKDRQFLKRLCEEYTMKEISSEMNIDIRTLDWRKTKLFELLGKRTVAGLVNFCIVNGIFNPYTHQSRMTE